VIELDGKILTQSYAILRHFARLLGQYEGTTEDEMYWADAMCDIAIDCTLQTPSLLCGLVRWERRLIDGLLGDG